MFNKDFIYGAKQADEFLTLMQELFNDDEVLRSDSITVVLTKNNNQVSVTYDSSINTDSVLEHDSLTQ